MLSLCAEDSFGNFPMCGSHTSIGEQCEIVLLLDIQFIIHLERYEQIVAHWAVSTHVLIDLFLFIWVRTKKWGK